MDTSMSLSFFASMITDRLRKQMGESYKISSGTVRKNNGIELVGIMIGKEGCNTSPTIYINDFYEAYKKGTDTEIIAKQIMEIYRESCHTGSVDLSDFTDYEKAKKQIAFKLINYEKNWELLKEVPHKVFHNLAIVFYYIVMQPPFDGNASVLIYHSHVKNWKISEEELWRNAMINTPFLLPAQIKNIENIMCELLDAGMIHRQNMSGKKDFLQEEAEEFLNLLKQEESNAERNIPMYVLTNSNKMFGAACMLYPRILKKFAEEKKCDLYILPSSVHEVILLLKEEGMGEKELLNMVTEINHTQVEEREILADAIYYYDRKKEKIVRLS